MFTGFVFAWFVWVVGLAVCWCLVVSVVALCVWLFWVLDLLLGWICLGLVVSAAVGCYLVVICGVLGVVCVNSFLLRFTCGLVCFFVWRSVVCVYDSAGGLLVGRFSLGFVVGRFIVFGLFWGLGVFGVGIVLLVGFLIMWLLLVFADCLVLLFGFGWWFVVIWFICCVCGVCVSALS